MSPIETAIDFFVKRKFGFIAAIHPALRTLARNEHNVMSEKEVEIEDYKRTLRNMPESELLTLHKRTLAEDAEQAKQTALREENNRFYNLASANADFVHWSKAAHWTIDEAIALSFGKEPEIVTWQKIEPFKDKSAFVKAFAKRRDLAMRAARWKKFHDLIPPVTFISWAKEIQIDLPPELIEEVSKIGGIAINWHEQYLKVKSELEALKAKQEPRQKPESTRKSENLLRTVAGIAIHAYGYKPQEKKSTAPNEVSVALSEFGVSITPQTIREWIKEGIELMPQYPDGA